MSRRRKNVLEQAIEKIDGEIARMRYELHVLEAARERLQATRRREITPLSVADDGPADVPATRRGPNGIDILE